MRGQVKNPPDRLNPGRFVYVEFGAKPTWHTGTFIPKDKVEEYATRYKRRDVYVSAFSFAEQENPSDETLILGDLYFDIDSEDEVSKAQEDARTVIEIINKELDIPKECIRLYFTGKKGFRILVPWECFGLEPSRDLHEVWKLAARHFHEAGCACIDLQVYQKNRFLRIPNTIHGDTGLYMIPITADELRGLGVEQIRDLARRPRQVEFAQPSPSEKAKEFYETMRRSLITMDDAKPETADMTEIENLRKACPAVDDCYQKIERGEPLSHEQHVFISKALLAFGKEGEDEVHRILKLSMGDGYDSRLTQYQINYSRSGKWPPGCEFARKSWGICAKCDGSTSPIERMRDLPMHVSVSDLRAELVGRRVVMDVQIAGEQSQKALPRVLSASCSRCDRESDVDMLEHPEALIAYFFKKEHRAERICEQVFEDENGPCRKNMEHRVKISPQKDMDFAVLHIRDLLQKTSRFVERMYSVRRIFLANRRVPNAKKLRVHGRVLVEPSDTFDISVLVEDVEPLEDEITCFQINDELRQGFVKHFREPIVPVWEQVAPDIAERRIAKQWVSLLRHSVAEIPDINGRLIRGSLLVIFFGDTKTSKSTTAEDGLDALGEYVTAETGRRSGILYSIDPEKRLLIWGVLPLNDMGLVVIDALDRLSDEEMGEFRESLTKQRVKVDRMVRGEAMMRVRIIGCLNPFKAMRQYAYPCMAISNNRVFHNNPPNITRWDVFVPFSKEDVKEGTIVRHIPKSRPVPDDVYTRHVLWAWSRRSDQVKYEDDAKQAIMEVSERLMKTYMLSTLPIVHAGIRDVVTRISVAAAAESHSTDETHEVIMVKKEHVERGVALYEETLKLLQLEEYKIEEERKVRLEPEEMEEIVAEVGDIELRILKEIKLQPSTSGVLAAKFEMDEKTIRRHCEPLKRFNLLAAIPGRGMSIAPRGLDFLRGVAQNLWTSGQKMPGSQGEQATSGQKMPGCPEGSAGGTQKIESFVETPLAMLMNAVRCLSGARDNGGYATIEALREISKTCGIEEERLETYLRRMLERGLIMEIEEGKFRATG